MSKDLILPTSSYYTLQDVFNKNGDKFNNIRITMTVRHTKEIEAGRVVAIGSIPGGKGAPPKVYAKTPLIEDVLRKAEENGIQLADRVREKIVNVVSIENSSQMTPVNILNNSVSVVN